MFDLVAVGVFVGALVGDGAIDLVAEFDAAAGKEVFEADTAFDLVAEGEAATFEGDEAGDLDGV